MHDPNGDRSNLSYPFNQSPPTNPRHRRESFNRALAWASIVPWRGFQSCPGVGFNRALVWASIGPRALGTAQGRALFEALCCEPAGHSWYAQAHLIALVLSQACK